MLVNKPKGSQSPRQRDTWTWHRDLFEPKIFLCLSVSKCICLQLWARTCFYNTSSVRAAAGNWKQFPSNHSLHELTVLIGCWNTSVIRLHTARLRLNIWLCLQIRSHLTFLAWNQTYTGFHWLQNTTCCNFKDFTSSTQCCIDVFWFGLLSSLKNAGFGIWGSCLTDHFL